MVQAPAQAKERAHKGVTTVMYLSETPAVWACGFANPEPEFGAWQGSGLGTVLQGAMSQG